MAWTWRELTDNRVPLPSVADVGFLLCLPLMTAAMVLFAIVSGYPASWVRVLIDGVVVALSLFGITWIFSLGTFLLDNSSLQLEQLIVTAYPLGDVLALAIALAALAHSRKRDIASFGLVAAGILGLGFSDLAFLYQTQNGRFQSGTTMDLGWLMGFFLIGLAALYRPERPVEASDSRPEDFIMREVLPYGAAAALLLIATAQALAGRPVDGTLMVIMTAVVLMNMIKQIPLRRAKAEFFAESLDTAQLSSDVVWVTEAVAAELAWLQETEDDIRAQTGSGSRETALIDLDVLTMRALYASQQAEKLNVKTLDLQKRISQCIPAHRIPAHRRSGRTTQADRLAPPGRPSGLTGPPEAGSGTAGPGGRYERCRTRVLGAVDNEAGARAASVHRRRSRSLGDAAASGMRPFGGVVTGDAAAWTRCGFGDAAASGRGPGRRP